MRCLVAAVARTSRPAGAAALAAVAARATLARTARAVAAAATAAGSDADELLGRLTGDFRVVGQAQADAATLAVDLDHADLDLVALVEHVLDGLHALAGRDVGD